ncbi:4-alpha-L-fucosyltransferase (glycosyl transferase family 56) [Salegentibacter sp. 24]|uniref:TDP-N-acetylfucosamine:lipid II N-acetylfucosaminyltransferase n=1 Tax=Salegentibacter sp. 24 TaxID=2183986 RepID=UPI0010EB84F4|nr:TDP-N-acetylfucosamine:lipid II N-acetylfucosaminyltransferase [Salegentibacter sp. 24]TDN82186.1 4-alpha-L-fucosyltransferase (glycosyl transferase family 56) [Salegentibacter sp. 24]
MDDEKFIAHSIKIFEQKFPKKNLFLVDGDEKSLKHLGQSDKIRFFKFNNHEIILDLIIKSSNDKKVVNIFTHFLNYRKASLVNQIKNTLTFNSYWIFYGADIYNRLYLKGRYELYDYNKNISPFYLKLKRKLRKSYYYFNYWKEELAIKIFINDLDFFCFWNIYDFEIVKEHYETNAEFKEFIYDSFSIDELEYPRGISSLKGSKKVNCLVNHSGSLSGNHLTLLKKLNEDQIKNLINRLIVPLNYGNDKIIKMTDEFCRMNFKKEYSPILNFLTKEQYFTMLREIDIAFFGHRRQEAGGNLTFLIAAGTKIYLRNDNNLLAYYNNLGIKIFSFEDDFNGDLSPLSLEFKQRNYALIMSKFNEDSVLNMYEKLIINS